MALKERFWRESAESLQAKIDRALKAFWDADRLAKSYTDWYGKQIREKARELLIETIKSLGFSEADALRWARMRKRRP